MIITKTDRLTFRRLTLEDLDALAPIFADPEGMKLLGGPRDKKGVSKWIKDRINEYERDGFSLYILIYNQNNSVIGFSGLKSVNIDDQAEIELCYHLDHAYWNQGLGTESAIASKEYGFNTLAANRLICCIPLNHTVSIKIATKLGMQYEKDTIYQNKFPAHIYAVNKSQ